MIIAININMMDLWMVSGIVCITWITARVESLLIIPKAGDDPQYADHERYIHQDTNSTISWTIYNDRRDPYLGQGHLLFRHENTILADYNLDTRTRSNVSSDEANVHLSFFSPEISTYGYRLINVRTNESGKYSCSFKFDADTPEVGREIITVFVYAPPTTPLVIPQTPVIQGNDVIFQCVTESQSQPVYLRNGLEFTWFRTATGSTTVLQVSSSSSAYPIANNLLTVRNMKSTDAGARYSCEVHEIGSDFILKSLNHFQVLLISIDQGSPDQEELEEGQNTSVTWQVVGTSDRPPAYNHSLVFSRNGQQVAEYHLRYRKWETQSEIGPRMAYYSPQAGQLGFRLFQIQPGDIGEYSCAFTDEFGTVVESDHKIKLCLTGHTYPKIETTSALTPPATSTGYADTHTEGKDVLGTTLGVSKPRASSASDPKTLPLILGSALGAAFGCLVLVLIVIIPIILCTRKKKDPKNTVLLRNSDGSDTVRRVPDHYHNDNRFSLYNTLRESAMVNEDVVRCGPSLPERDDTYNQAFEDTRRISRKQPPTNDGCQPSTSTPDRQNSQRSNATMLRSSPLLEERPDVEENQYLTPINVKGTPIKYYNSQSASCPPSPVSTQQTETPSNQEKSGPSKTTGGAFKHTNIENSYLTMGKDDATTAYMEMGKEDEEKNPKLEQELPEDMEYVNVHQVLPPGEAKTVDVVLVEA